MGAPLNSTSDRPAPPEIPREILMGLTISEYDSNAAGNPRKPRAPPDLKLFQRGLRSRDLSPPEIHVGPTGRFVTFFMNERGRRKVPRLRLLRRTPKIDEL